MEVVVHATLDTVNEENNFVYHVAITQGADQVNSEYELLAALKHSVPERNGIIEVSRLSDTLWEVITNNPNT